MLLFKKRIDDPNGLVSKLIFEDDTAIAETVVYKYKDRAVICFSVQSGCPIGCSFCGTGNKFIRHLTYDELKLQIETGLTEVLDYDNNKFENLQLMSMSMGEPMLNWGVTERFAVDMMKKYDCYFYVSTVGVNMPDIMRRIIRMGEKYPKFGLQFSLHKTNDIDRFNLFRNKNVQCFKISELVRWGRDFLNITKRKPYYNFIVTGNETEEDLRIFATHFKDFHITLSVMCDTKGLTQADRNIVEQFAYSLIMYSKGQIEISVFDPAGQDTIGGGCGQLLYVQEKLNLIQTIKQ